MSQQTKQNASKAKLGRPEAEPIPASFDSLSQCAGYFNVSVSAFRKIKKLGCPAFRGSRVYTLELLTWLVAWGKPVVSFEDARTLECEARAKLIEAQVREKERTLVDIFEIGGYIGRCLGAIRNRVDAMPLDLPHKVDPTNPDSIREVLNEWRNQLLRSMRDGVTEVEALYRHFGTTNYENREQTNAATHSGNPRNIRAANGSGAGGDEPEMPSGSAENPLGANPLLAGTGNDAAGDQPDGSAGQGNTGLLESGSGPVNATEE